MSKSKIKKNKKIEIYNIQNEQVILSNMIQSTKIRKELSRILIDENFIGNRHKIIFNALKLMTDKGLEYNEDTLSQLSEGDFGGISYIRDLEQYFEENANIEYHTKVLVDDSIKYGLRTDEVSDLMSILDDPKSSQEDIYEKLNRISSKINRFSLDIMIKSGDILYKDYINKLKERAESGSFVPFGIEGLDRNLTEGLMKKKVIIVAARPGMGKTTFISNVAANLLEQSKRVLVCPLETGLADIVDNIVSMKTGIEKNFIKKDLKDMDPKRKARIMRKSKEILTDKNLSFIEDRDLTLGKLNQILMAEEYDVCMIDLFEKLDDVNLDNLDEKLEELQKVAQNTNTCILITAQIRRFNMGANSAGLKLKPTLEQLKNAGKYEEIADLVIGLYREKYYDSEAEDILEQIVLKQRNGIFPYEAYHEFIAELGKIGIETNNPDIDLDVF